MMILDFIKLEGNKSHEISSYVAVNELKWRDLISKVCIFTDLLKKEAPTRLMLKIPNTPNGVALLLASSQIPCETIIMPDYQSDELAADIVKEYEVSHYFALDGDELVNISHQSVAPKKSDQAYLCLLTSGTTGIPKCVKHSWASLLSRIKIDPRFKGNSWFLGYPVTHFAGLQVTLQALSNFGSLIIPKNYEPAECINLIATFHPNYINCTPTFMRQMLLSNKEFDWKSSGVRRITFGGEVVDQSIIDLMKKHIPTAGISHIYASTELGALITVTDEREGFPAELIDNIKFKLVDHELYVKPSISSMLQYLNKEKVKKDEWIATKDIIHIEGERALFHGRKDDLINIGGYKVRPAVVEKVIRELDGVKEVIVIGQKNPIMGFLLTAKVQTDANTDSKVLKRTIFDTCKKKLPEYMVPRMIQFVDELAMTQTRKLIRRSE